MSTPRTAVITWDWKEWLPLDELRRAIHDLTGGEIALNEIDTGSDQFAIVLAPTYMDDAAVRALYEEATDG